jgi:hypothetical protein
VSRPLAGPPENRGPGGPALPLQAPLLLALPATSALTGGGAPPLAVR